MALCFLPLVFALSTIGLVAAGHWLDRDKLAENYLKLADREVAAWEKQWAPGGAANSGETSSTTEAAAKPDKPAEIPASAEMLFRRVQQLQSNDARSTFFIALSYLQRGGMNQGFSMLSRIAPSDRIGYLPAHAIIAESMLSRPMAISEIPIVKHHAEAAMRWDRVSPQLLAMISELFAKLELYDNAVRAMRLAAERDAKFYLLLAQVASKDKKYGLVAQESLEKAATHLTTSLEKNPRDATTRLMLADVYRMRADFSEAEKTLLDGLALSDDQLLKTGLSEVYRQAFAKSSRFSGNTWSGDLELLDKAYRLDPNNLRIYDEVAGLASLTGKVASEELMAQLRTNLAAGRATSITHLWIAEHYLRTNDFRKAIPHLEQAVQRDPDASRGWNNLAYCLADVDPDRLGDAIKFANRAVMLAPDVPDYHDTRGTVLMKMHKPGEAIAAFEQAIEAAVKSGGKFPQQPDYHLRLADAYAAAGDQAMANTHKEFAAKLAKSISDARAARAANANANAAANPEESGAEPTDRKDVQAPTDSGKKSAEVESSNNAASEK